jgi:hypothetical protein
MRHTFPAGATALGALLKVTCARAAGAADFLDNYWVEAAL